MAERLTKDEQIALWRAAQEGDQRAHNRLAHFLTNAAIGRLHKTYGRSSEWCEDIVQNGWMKWERSPYDPRRGTSPLTWFCTLCHSSAKDAFRAEAREREWIEDKQLDSISNRSERDLRDLVDAEELVRALRSLSPLERDALLGNLGLRLTHDKLNTGTQYSQEQLGEMSDMTRSVIYRRKHKALQILRTLLQSEEGGCQ